MDPGWVEIIPLKRVTVHVRTWLLSAQTERQQTERLVTGQRRNTVTTNMRDNKVMVKENVSDSFCCSKRGAVLFYSEFKYDFFPTCT